MEYDMEDNTETIENIKAVQSVVNYLYGTQNHGNIFSTPSNFVVNSREENDKNKDIEILENISQSITDYDNDQSSIRETMIKIGGLFGEVTFNDNGDKDSHYIRNRHGYIRRNRNKSTNPQGIYFERFYHFKIIFTNDRVYSQIPPEEIADLERNLSFLKQKIRGILIEYKPNFSYQNTIDNVNNDITASVFRLTQLSRKYYKPMNLERIVDELESLESIDFSIQGDRYYFARAFCIVGELLNEYLEDQDDTEGKQAIMKSLKSLVTLRNQIVHHSEKLKIGFGNRNQLMSELIIEIKNHLTQLIVNTGNRVDQWSVDSSYTDVDEFDNSLERFMKIFTEKSRKKKPEVIEQIKSQNKTKDSETQEIDKEITNKLKRLIRRAYGIIEGTTAGVTLKSKSETIEDQLKFLDDQYQIYLDKLESNNRNNYPRALNLINKEAMNMSNECTHQNSNQNPHQPVDQLTKKTERFVSKIESIKEEVDYLNNLFEIRYENQEKMLSKKMIYICQYIIAVIGQLVRDIQDINICEQIRQASESDINDFSKLLFDKFSSSNLINEGSITSKTMRNQGLAHNIWSYEEVKFLNGFKDIMSIFPQLSNYYHIFVKDIKTMTGELFSMIGRSFYSIGLYDEAITYLEKAESRFREYPHEGEISEEKYDEVKHVFQMDLLKLNTYIALMFAYEKCGYSDKVLSTGEMLLNLVQFDKITRTTTLATKSIYFVLHSMSNVSRDLEYFKPIVEKLEFMSVKYDNIYLKTVLADFYCKMENFQMAKLFYKILYEETSQITIKVGILFGYVGTCDALALRSNQPSDVTETNEIIRYIDELEVQLEENLYELKSTFGDEYLKQKRNLINLKLYMMKKQKPGNFDEFEIQKFKQLSKQYRDINSRLPEPFRDYCILSVVNYKYLLEYFIDMSLKFPASRVESVKEAQYYFDLLVKNIDRFPKELPHLKPYIKKYGQMICLFALANQNYGQKDETDGEQNINNVLEEMNISEYDVQTFLGKEFFNQGEIYLEQFYDSGKEQGATLAVNSYDNAIKYINMAIENCQNVETVLSLSLRIVGYCLTSKSLLTYELSSLIYCLDYWNALFLLPLESIDRICALECKEVIEDILSQIQSILIKIKDSIHGSCALECHDEYIIRYLKNKFNIEIIDEDHAERWIYDGSLSKEELKNHIKQELNCFGAVLSFDFLNISEN